MKQYPHQRHAKDACQTKENERKPSIPIAYLPLNQKPLKMSKTKLNFHEELSKVADLFAQS